jgi:anti-sigma-K factor RskA
MKKRMILWVAMAALLVCATAYAQSFVNGSGSKSASALILDGTGKLHGIVVTTDGTNAQTVDIYDNTSATGTKLIPTWVVTTSSTDRTQSIGFYPPVNFNTGCYVNVSGSGTVGYVVYYTR